MVHIPKLVAKVMPKSTSSGMNQQLIYAGIEMTSEEVVSITLVYSVVVAVVAYLVAIVLEVSQLITLIVVMVTFGAVWIAPVILLSILTTRRAEAVEETLPDVLSMVAQNMKAGMTSYNALWSAARPEFGPLAIEIQDVAKATLTGIPLTDALVGMTHHVKSTKLPRSVRLIIQGMKSGGDLPAVLQAITMDMRREQNLKKQMAAETSAHAVFILFAIVFGAPLLFAVSYQFIDIFSTMMDRLNISELGANSPQSMVTLSELAISPGFFQLYAIGILAISGLFGSLLIGILRTGSPVSGIPSIPALVIIPALIFFVMQWALGLFFGNMVNF
jgi:Flp pilus assembly protein TadB